MGRLMLVVFLLIVLIGGLGFLALGAFPPEPATAPVHKIMPNDRFSRGT
jgi:Na+-transporting methylmalonyl-CoA/oxaloacetate decarboxylase gamma subunit